MRIPQKMRRLLASCLQKDPKQRLQAIGDYRLLLEEPAGWRACVTDRLGWAMAASLASGARNSGLPVGGARRGQWSARSCDWSVDLGPDAVAGQFTTTAISPDGARLAFPFKNPDGKQKLATRLLERDQADGALGNRKRKRPVLFAGWKMDRVFRRWKNGKDLGPGRCTSSAVRRPRRARSELGGPTAT